MALIRDNHMVQQFSAATTDPTLRHTVLPRTSETGPLRLNTEALHCVGHFFVKIRAASSAELSSPRRQLPTQRSATPFCHGLRKLVRFGSIPKLFTVLDTSSLKFAPRSKIRKPGAES